MMSSQSRFLGNGSAYVRWILLVLQDPEGSLLLGEGAVQQPRHDREVLALIVRRQDNRVLVLGGFGHCEGWRKEQREENETAGSRKQEAVSEAPGGGIGGRDRGGQKNVESRLIA